MTLGERNSPMGPSSATMLVPYTETQGQHARCALEELGEKDSQGQSLSWVAYLPIGLGGESQKRLLPHRLLLPQGRPRYSPSDCLPSTFPTKGSSAVFSIWRECVWSCRLILVFIRGTPPHWILRGGESCTNQSGGWNPTGRTNNSIG